MEKSIGSGKIEVRFKADASQKFDTLAVQCKGIEFYGERMAFSDADGDLVRSAGRIIEALPSDIFSIKAK